MTLQKHQILICEDEEGVRESFKLILEKDYSLDFAVNGVEGLEKLKKSNPSLMILDIKMPKSHGIEVLKEVKKIKPSLPILIVTGYQSVEMAQEAIRLGASDYIPKPFESKTIKTAVEKSIKR